MSLIEEMTERVRCAQRLGCNLRVDSEQELKAAKQIGGRPVRVSATGLPKGKNARRKVGGQANG